MRWKWTTLVVVIILIGVGCGPGKKGEVKSVEPSEGENILAAEEVSWEDLNEAVRRKVLFSGELTFVFLEIKGPSSDPIPLHSHPNDQISYVVEGELEVQVGEDVRVIGKGGFFRVPSNLPHGARALSPVVYLIDTFTPPREDFRKN